eukprot:TRINITY_DN21_c0_g1_i1.p2 TRINITY_DN21_c0_g1~~TRINITY_DN21_c0_g1_i1.p2  ORF type:complete len:232 (-),score=83.23 TRINITY_DN21_c0_g1_i1:93-788(-)
MAQPTDAASLYKNDAQLKALPWDKYSRPASQESLDKTVAALKAKQFNVQVAENKEEALKLLVNTIPAGVSVHNASSTSLIEIGFVEHFKTQTQWVNVHAQILAEKDQAKVETLRRTAGNTSDYFLTSVSALTESGETTIVDMSGSRVGPVAHGAGKVIFVLGSNKIVADAAAARDRTHNYQFALESARVRIAYAAYGMTASSINTELTINNGSPMAPGRYHFIIVKEALGY